MKKYIQVITLMNDWEIDPRKHLYQEIIKEVSPWCEVLLVQQPVCLLGHFFTKFRQKIIGLISGKYRTQKLQEGVFLFTPIIIFNYALWLKYKTIGFVDAFLLQLQLNRYMKRHFDGRYVILWIFITRLYLLIDKIKHDYLIYDFQDNYNYYGDGSKSEIDSEYNEKLVKRSNLIICTGREMYNFASQFSKNVFYIPNGNEYNTLTNNENLTLTTEISHIQKPIIGYLGGIRCFDFDLLHKLIKYFQDVEFVFIGIIRKESKRKFKDILSYANTTWIPYKEQNVLPSYLRKFNVGIIPFVINKYTDGIFPNKFLEYMALEIPIVTTALPDLKQYSNLIGYSYNADEFIRNCERALNGKFENIVKQYAKIAEENSWSKKAQTINKIIRKDCVS